MSEWPYNTTRWKQTRRLVLHQADYQCQIRGAKCTGYATVADHIIRLCDGGPPFDLANLRAACVMCNAEREGGRSGRQAPAPSRRW